MNQKQLIKTSIDEDGRMVIPPEIASPFGIRPGVELYVDEASNEFRVLRPTTQLAKIYIEVTNLCNLDCVSCMRNVWGEQPGKMSDQTFERVQRFDFSPCTLCNGCELSTDNVEDCLGNTGLACGGCLWAQGVIRCP